MTRLATPFVIDDDLIIVEALVTGPVLVVHLHNHTIRKYAGKPALGVTAPSANDVQFLRGLAEDTGLASAWVTNGVFTIEIAAAALAKYQTPASVPRLRAAAVISGRGSTIAVSSATARWCTTTC